MIAYRRKTGLYVAQVPGDGGVDWGYTNNPKSQYDPALDLTPYWQKRFSADAKRCNDEAVFINIAGAIRKNGELVK